MRSSVPPHLTPTERVVMQHYVSGVSRERIAAEMGLSCHTIAMHLRRVKRKLGARNMAQAGARYVDIVRISNRETADARLGLVPPDTSISEKSTTSGNIRSANTVLR